MDVEGAYGILWIVGWHAVIRGVAVTNPLFQGVPGFAR